MPEERSCPERYTGCYASVKPGVTPRLVPNDGRVAHGAAMRETFKRTFVKEWREFRGLSLRRLADRLVDPTTFDPIITAQSLSRIERGLQPYSQPVLEALAAALECSPGDLLDRDPNQTQAIWALWGKFNEAQRRQAIELLRVLERTSVAA